MVFSGLTFLLYFLPAVLILYFIRPGTKWRNTVLLVFSLLFYAWGEPIWISAMLASTLVNFWCARAMNGKTGASRRLYLYIGAGFSLALLFAFKYAAFFINSVLSVLAPGASINSPELPIGISFYTFQVLTYTVDVYRGGQKAQRRFSRLLLYVCCFPQLIAGPIVRYADVAKEISSRRSTPRDFSEGMLRFVRGLAKKVLISNICAEILEELPLAGGAGFCCAGAWYGAAVYTLQIYFDFSGYSDMAIGLGRIFGFHYKENFDHPYASFSVREFWRRWHMSLGGFFREYVYIPLGGNRAGLKRTIINTLIVWGLTGLWHGANWTYILWGLYYGGLLTVDLLWGKKYLSRLPKAVHYLLTLLLVTVGWVIFYYSSLGQVFTHLGAMLGIGVRGMSDKTLTVIKTYSVFPIIAFIFSLPVRKYAGALTEGLLGARVYEIIRVTAASALLVLSVMFIIGLSSNPFIYFQF